MTKQPMGFQWSGRHQKFPKSEDDYSPDLQRITAIPREPTSSILQGCNVACEAMNRDWGELAPEIGGEWVCKRDLHHYSIFFRGRTLSPSERRLMFLLAWQILPQVSELGLSPLEG